MLLVAGNDSTLYGLDQRTGGVIWRMLAEGPIHTAPAVGTIATADAASPAVVVVGGDDGICVPARRCPTGSPSGGGPCWRADPLVARRRRWCRLCGDNRRLGPRPGSRDRHRAVAVPRRTVGPITADLTLHDGVLYVATSDPTGNVILLDVATGEEICRRETDAAIDVNPIVSDEVAYVANTGESGVHVPRRGLRRPCRRQTPLAPAGETGAASLRQSATT